MTPVALKLPTRTDLLQALFVQTLARDHAGRKRGISAAALAAKLGVTERTLRELVSAAREDGVAVAGTPATGYFVALTAPELEECCRFLRARAMHSLTLESRLRKIPLPELLGLPQLSTT